jgi:hypothetical protein
MDYVIIYFETKYNSRMLDLTIGSIFQIKCAHPYIDANCRKIISGA